MKRRKEKSIPPLRMRTGKDLRIDILVGQFKPETDREAELEKIIIRQHESLVRMEESITGENP